MTEPRISEYSSEIQPRQRGRPKAFSETQERVLGGIGLWEEHHSRRHKVDVMYRQRALGVIWKAPDFERFRWLTDDLEAIKSGKGRVKKLSIVTELGRLDSPGVMLHVAERIARMKPKTRFAIVLIRSFRGGAGLEKSSEGLMMAVLRAVDEYCLTHDDMSPE